MFVNSVYQSDNQGASSDNFNVLGYICFRTTPLNKTRGADLFPDMYINIFPNLFHIHGYPRMVILEHSLGAPQEHNNQSRFANFFLGCCIKKQLGENSDKLPTLSAKTLERSEDIFISHTWSAGGWSKILSLLMQSGCMNAFAFWFSGILDALEKHALLLSISVTSGERRTTKHF